MTVLDTEAARWTRSSCTFHPSPQNNECLLASFVIGERLR